MAEIEVAIPIEIEATNDLPSYRDTLFMPLADYTNADPVAIETMKAERYDAWRKSAFPTDIEKAQAAVQQLLALDLDDNVMAKAMDLAAAISKD